MAKDTIYLQNFEYNMQIKLYPFSTQYAIHFRRLRMNGENGG